MGQRPLSSAGGEAQKVYARFPEESIDRLDRLAARKGLTRSEYLRRAIEAAFAADEPQEATRAS